MLCVGAAFDAGKSLFRLDRAEPRCSAGRTMGFQPPCKFLGKLRDSLHSGWIEMGPHIRLDTCFSIFRGLRNFLDNTG